MKFRNWGATPEEINEPIAGDDVLPDARTVATRCITIEAQPEDVFPWLRQMGFRRAGWYSYDIIDNLGQKSATSIVNEWQLLDAGDLISGGPVNFEAVIVDAPRALVIRLITKKKVPRRISFVLSYELRRCDEGTRLVTRMRTKVDVPGGMLIERLLLAPADGVMVRKQLINIARRCRSQRG